MVTTTERTCGHCGATEGVAPTVEYVGGEGYVTRDRCADLVVCWARWDTAHGFSGTPAQQLLALRADPTAGDGLDHTGWPLDWRLIDQESDRVFCGRCAGERVDCGCPITPVHQARTGV